MQYIRQSTIYRPISNIIIYSDDLLQMLWNWRYNRYLLYYTFLENKLEWWLRGTMYWCRCYGRVVTSAGLGSQIL